MWYGKYESYESNVHNGIAITVQDVNLIINRRIADLQSEIEFERSIEHKYNINLNDLWKNFNRKKDIENATGLKF